jgi:trehalose/maltose transport system substrate-binding protein
MAARIQSGERAKGRKNFWGYVWQGAPTEALTCDALEWQASEGGGWIVEADQTISVNNPQAIRSWQRAAHWVGSISPPSVTSFNEEDTLNVWLDGDAAFMRTWPPAYGISQVSSSQVRNKFNVALLPGGRAGQFGTLGGIALAVSRSSAHPREALELVRFLSRRDVELQRSHAIGEAPVRSELYELPELLAPNPQFALLGRAFGSAAVSRPSNVTGKKYEEVSDAYQRAVNSVLTHKKTAPDAAATLERELVRITGFRTGPPSLSERLAREGH